MWPEIRKENHWGEKPRGEAGTAASKAAERSGEGRLNVVAFGVSDEEEGRRALVQRSGWGGGRVRGSRGEREAGWWERTRRYPRRNPNTKGIMQTGGSRKECWIKDASRSPEGFFVFVFRWKKLMEENGMECIS